MNFFDGVKQLMDILGYRSNLHPKSVCYALRLIIYLSCFGMFIFANICIAIKKHNELDNSFLKILSICLMMFSTFLKSLSMYHNQNEFENLFIKIQKRVNMSKYMRMSLKYFLLFK